MEFRKLSGILNETKIRLDQFDTYKNLLKKQKTSV